MSLEWREQLSVGNDVIDNDHKYLIELINRIELSLGPKNLFALTEAISSLEKYSVLHFAAEEKIAHAAGYPKVSHLNASHTALTEKLDQMKQGIGECWDEAASERFITLLREWLINHVIKEDLQMKPFLAKRSPAFDPR